MINPSWTFRPIDELFDIGAGKTMSAAARDGVSQVPFLRTSNVFWDEIDLAAVDTMSLSPEELQKKILVSGDLLVCEGGDIGRSAIWNGETRVMSFQNHLHRLRAKVADVEPRFYVYYLQSAFTQLGVFEGAGNTTTIPNLSRNRLGALEVPHPSLNEQRDVVRVLARVRSAVKRNDQAAALAGELRRAAMETLFTRGLRGELLKETDIGPMPESWALTSIGDIALSTQYGLSVRGQSAGSYPILRMNCQEEGLIHYRNLQFVDLDEKIYSNFRLNPGDLLFNRTNSIELVGRTAIVKEVRPAVFASYLVRLTVDEQKCRPPFLNYFMNWPVTQNDIKKLASRAVGQANINASKLRTIRFPLPSLEEQDEIVTVLDAIDQKMSLHRRKRAVLNDLFRALLHKLMTGEIRVADLDLSALWPPGAPQS